MDAGATVDLQGHDGSGVLHVAAGHDRHELVCALLERSAKTSHSDQEGATALHVAARNGQCDLAMLICISSIFFKYSLSF